MQHALKVMHFLKVLVDKNLRLRDSLAEPPLPLGDKEDDILAVEMSLRPQTGREEELEGQGAEEEEDGEGSVELVNDGRHVYQRDGSAGDEGMDNGWAHVEASLKARSGRRTDAGVEAGPQENSGEDAPYPRASSAGDEVETLSKSLSNDLTLAKLREEQQRPPTADSVRGRLLGSPSVKPKSRMYRHRMATSPSVSEPGTSDREGEKVGSPMGAFPRSRMGGEEGRGDCQEEGFSC